MIFFMGTTMALAQNTFPSTGNVGIGTTSPQKKLHIFTQPSDRQIRLEDNAGFWEFWAGGNFHVREDGAADRFFIQGNTGNVGIGTTSPQKKLHIFTQPSDRQIRLGDNAGFWEFWAGGNFHVREDGAADRFFIQGNTGNVGVGTTSPGARLEVIGMTRTGRLQITGGSDLAEPFEIAAAEVIKPGMLVSIDPMLPGQLRISGHAYDRTVAGVVSGANGVDPGLTMGQKADGADGFIPVALTGRVYALADAGGGPITPGDLLTTSDNAGYAMKVTDHAKAQGAIIGKAMSSLARGRGLVLVLVSLQ
jgi:hypothetical protein